MAPPCRDRDRRVTRAVPAAPAGRFLRRGQGVVAGALLLASASAACEVASRAPPGSGASSVAAAQPLAAPIELITWWVGKGASDPLGILIKTHQARFPRDMVLTANSALSGVARKAVRSRLRSEEPPDVFQSNIGSDHLQWVITNGNDDRDTKVQALDSELPEEVATWRRVMPPALLSVMTYSGKLYGVPANVHQINEAFYNHVLLARHGLTEPHSLAELRALGKALRRLGIPLIGIGTRDPWPLALLAFECVLIAEHGPRFYRSYFSGEEAPDDPRMVQTLRDTLDLLQDANPNHRTLSMFEGIDLVVRGKAAMTVMGDWAALPFRAANLVAGDEYREDPFPETGDVFVFTADVFSLAVGAKNKAGAKRLLGTIGSIEAQAAVNDAVGALPARLDVPMPLWDVLRKRRQVLLQHGELALAQSGIVPARFAEDVNAALADMVERNDIEPVLQTLRTRYPLLSDLIRSHSR